MDTSYTDNVLAEIEEKFRDIVKEEDASQLDAEFHDVVLQEFNVVDSWEIGGVDDIHYSDISYEKLVRRPRHDSCTRRKEEKFSRRDDNYYDDKYHSRSHSKPSGYRPLPRRSRERRTLDTPSVEHLRVSLKNSPERDEKLPDLKCTTSVETGEINVVLLTEDKNASNSHEEAEKSVSDSVRKKPPTLLKNPFAYARLRRKISESPERRRVREFEASPRHSIDRQRKESRDSRSFDSRNKDRSSSSFRPKSNRRASPCFYDRRSRRQSVSHSSERYAKRRRSDHRRSRESSRWHSRSRSREGSVLSRVSSKSSLSFISMGGRSPHEHNRKQSPLRPYPFYNEPKQSNENYFSSSEDFNHKLSLLLKESKQKQSTVTDESGPFQSSSYPNPTWKADDWNNQGGTAYAQPQDAGVSYAGDAVGKPNYGLQQTEYPAYPQGQYNQVYYNNQVQNYPNMYGGDANNSIQPLYNYGQVYPNQIPNQYYPPATPVAMNYPSTSYAEQPAIGHYQQMHQPIQQPMAGSMVQPPLNIPQQHYNTTNNQLSYMGMNSQPEMSTQLSVPPVTSQNNNYKWPTSERQKDSRKWVPTRTAITITPEETNSNEEDPMHTPPPPVISDTWREIESAEKGSWKGTSKKWEVLAKCEKMLQKLMSNDPSVERFKVAQCDNFMQFSLKEEDKLAPNLISRNAVRAARRLAKTLRFQSPLLRRRNNPRLKFTPWMQED